jgi:hypothetical protein
MKRMPWTPFKIRTASFSPDGFPAGKSICVASPVMTAFEPIAQAGEKHLHLLRRGVLRFVENHEGVVQGSAAHECQRRHFDGAAFD